MNEKGLFITLSALFLGMLILSTSLNLNTSETLTNQTINLALAGQRAGFVKEIFLEVSKTIYVTGSIEWDKQDNNFIYIEEFPNTIAKDAMKQNFSYLKEFMKQEYPDNNFFPESADMSRIFIYEKDFEVHHSGSGYSDNTQVNFTHKELNFSPVQFDLNIVDSNDVRLVSEGMRECNNCSEPVDITINVYDNEGRLSYNYTDTIDITKNHSLRLSTTGTGNDLSFDYSPQTNTFTWTKTSDPAIIKAIFSFDDSYFTVSLDKNILEINEMLDFGFKG